MGQRERDGAAAGAEVGDGVAGTRLQPLQRQLDQQFGLGTRDQGVRRDLEFQRPEFATTGQVGERRAVGTRAEQRAVVRHHRVLGDPLRPREQVTARALEGVGEQQLGLEARAVAELR